MEDAIDETTLVAALKAGEAWAFECLVRTYGGRLLAVARRFVRNASRFISASCCSIRSFKARLWRSC